MMSNPFGQQFFEPATNIIDLSSDHSSGLPSLSGTHPVGVKGTISDLHLLNDVAQGALDKRSSVPFSEHQKEAVSNGEVKVGDRLIGGTPTRANLRDDNISDLPISAAATVVPNAFLDIDNFDSRLNGSVRNQGSWKTNQPGSTDGAIVTSTPPNAFSGRALMNDPAGIQFRGNAYTSLRSSAIANNTIGTFFFQIFNDSLASSNLSIGLSDVSAPGLGSDNTGTPVSFGDYEIQVTFANGELRVRDGNRTRKVNNLALQDDTLYNFWMVADTGSDTYNVYVQGGNITNQTQLAVNGNTDFDFRNGNASTKLRTYLQLNGTANPPTAKSYIDLLAIDPNNENLANPAPRFSAVETFESISTGNINGRRGWLASSNGASVVSDPSSVNNKVLRVTGANAYARKSTPDIANGTNGTLFFRLRRSGNVNSSVGLSDRPQATTWSDFENQVGFQNSNQLKIRDGGAFDAIGTIAPNLWHGVWLVTNNATDTYEVYVRGGSFNTVTQLSSGAQTNFDYRNGTNSALSDFLVRTGLNNSGALLIDDIYLDGGGTNLSLPDSNGVEFSQNNTVPLSDPIPETIDPSGLSVTLNEIAQIPASQSNKPLARINYLTHANDNSNRLFVNDLNDKLYVIDNGNISTYLNVKARFPDFVDSPRLGTGFGFFAFAPDFAQSGKFYTVHTEAGNALSKPTDYSPKTSTSVHGIITEWIANNPAANTFSGTKRELLRIGFETFLHGFQQIGFNPTATPGSPDYGLLYLAVGDGEQNPLFSNGPQDLSVPHGKILRIDPGGSNSPNRKYGIPDSNPFVLQNSSLDEIWAYGLRNPHRFSWDLAGSNQMFIANIGEKNIESIYPGIAGANYGWNIREGAFRFDKSDPNNVFSLPANDDQFDITYPVAQWDHDEGLAVVGGFVYRGEDIPQLTGKYIFGDIVSGRIFYTDVEDMVVGSPPALIEELLLKDVAGNQQTLLDLVDSRRADLRFGIDAERGIYILSKQTGQIWRLENSEGNSGGQNGNDDTLLFSLKNWTALSGLNVADEDIILYENNSFERFFDGSDMGLSSIEISAFDVISNNEILLSFNKPINLPELGRVDDSDVVKFIASSLGNMTSGRFEFYLDGSDVGLSKYGEDIDALALQSGGALLISTIGTATVPGSKQVADEDILKFIPTSFGSNTRGRWSRYFDGSDVSLANNDDEDIDALSVDSGDRISLSTQGDFSVRNLSGKDEDAFSFRASSTGSNTSGTFGPGLIFDGSRFGLTNNDVSGLDRKF